MRALVAYLENLTTYKMSDLLNKASLVVIPSGYKEDTVYSVVPSDGSGDLSFTRASNGTRINSSGLVEVCPWNMLQYSEDLSNVYWQKNLVTITSNTTVAPNGTTTADTLTNSSTGYGIYAVLDVIPSQQYTFSFYIKKGTNTSYKLSVIDASTFTSIASLDYSADVSATDWVRITQTFTTPSGTTSIRVYQMRDGSTTGTAFLWGAQLNIGSTAKPYFPTTDRLNVPRLTYQNGGGGCPSLLLEKQSTNLVTYSEQFDNAGWSKLDSGSGSTTPIVTANYAISPDGTQNADRLQCTLGSSGYSLIQQSPTIGGTHTGSIWVKSNTSANQNIYFRISANTTAFVVTPQWQRITLTEINGDYLTIGLRDSTGYTNYSCDILIWGAQLEASSYPTSYIPTTSASATRVADACSKTGISSLIGQTSGTVFVDAYIDKIEARTSNILFYLQGSGVDKYLLITSSGGVRYIDFPNGNITNNGYGLTNGRHKFAIAYANNDFAFYIDGNLIGTDTSGTPSVCSDFGFFYYASGYDFPLQVNEAVLFKTRLTNAELASLTTI